MTLPIIFSAASLILCGFFFIYFQSYLRKKTAPREILEDYRDEVNKLIFEIDAATERDSYLVEERIKSLKSLLEEVDKKIGIYVREFERRRSTETVYNALGRSGKPAAPPPESTVSAGKTPLREVSAAPAPPPAGPPGASALPLADADAPAPDSRPLKERVAELAAQGLAPDTIAARLKVSISEVELIIAIGGSAAGPG
jgi:hypothetical protein